MASFDENGKYIKTNWKAGDKITATKLNKIEESIEAVNDNDISRHVEADARLDALEAKDVAHDKELTDIKNTIADNKAAAELGDYDINSRMTFLENELNEGIEEVHNVAETVDGKIATAEANMTSAVAQGKADMEAMMDAVEGELDSKIDIAKAPLEAADATLQGNIDTLQANLEAADATLQNNISEIQNDIAYDIMTYGDDTERKLSYTLPGGLIIKAGLTINCEPGEATRINYDTPFPTNSVSVVLTMNGGSFGSEDAQLGIQVIHDINGFAVKHHFETARTFNYIAIGH